MSPHEPLSNHWSNSMTKRRVLPAITAAVAAPVLALGIAAPAGAMHSSPAPVDDPAPAFSGHYSTPDIGLKGGARPWEAGPTWNR
jgi:hypothetical protein